ncbi:UTP--glucose-1-phosphate uridylyltransferase [Candidatus Calditenuaceae archaeon HR02]|nr:UTP--glucose-1-phosphate uridylyltransferase [Candidatus Calditenuaceae archaeon HR02]
MIALIIAGGLGKRLRPLTDKVPKPLLELGGKAIAEWQIEWLVGHGFRRIVFCIGYLAEKFVERLGDGSKWGVEIAYSIEKNLLGTAGALKNAEEHCRGEDRILVVNGDVITDIDPLDVLEELNSGAIGAIALVPLPSSYGVVEFDADTRVIKAFREKPVLYDYWINAGVYGFSGEVFQHLPEQGSLEVEVFPKLSSMGRLRAVPFRDTFWRSVETVKDMEEVERFLIRRDAEGSEGGATV